MTFNTILVIAYRDLMKFLRDPARLVWAFIFPLVLMGMFGETMQANLGTEAGYSFRVFTFTGVFAQTLFMSVAQGLVSLLEDRENDFSQEIFISPVSRYAIVFGKIVGESLVALPQGLGIVALGALIGVPMSVPQLLALAGAGIVACLYGGAFGMILLSNFSSQRTANQIVPFIMIPQFFLAGVFTPIQALPWFLDFLSRISPMRYAVDLTRNAFYAGQTEYAKVVLDGPLANLSLIAAMFALFLVAGTLLFVGREQNR